jgi:hypothetical protein
MPALDATLKHIIFSRAKDFAVHLGAPADAQVRIVDSEIATVSYAADKVLLVETETPFLLHLEPQGYYDKVLDVRILTYNALLWRRHGVIVHSAVLFLHPDACGPKNTSRLTAESPLGHCHMEFAYQAIRVWELPVDDLLSEGIGILPLAPISDVAESELPSVIQRMAERFAEVDRAEAAEL